MLVNHDLPTTFIDTWGVTLELDIEPGRERGITRLEKADEEAHRQQSFFFITQTRRKNKAYASSGGSSLTAAECEQIADPSEEFVSREVRALLK